MIAKNVPVLLVGLGGIGGSIVDKVMGKLPESQKSFVGAVAIDTDLGDLNKLENAQKIWIGDTGIVKSVLNNNALNAIDWFPANKFINTRGLSEGAGQIRAIARLVLAASVLSDHNPLLILENEISRILRHSGNTSIERFNVFIAGSITGGTGAGSFLQIPYYIRDYMKKNMPGVKIQIRGMFVGPDITKNVNPSKINRDAVKINAYACLKELNALYLTQAEKESDTETLEFEFYDSKNWKREYEIGKETLTRKYKKFKIGENITGEEVQVKIKGMIDEGATIPYDSFYLVEGIDNEGTTGEASLETIKEQVAAIVYTLLFTPVYDSAASSANNETLLDIQCAGMNRYSSAGLCLLRYPYKQIKEYITLRFCKKIVNDEWILLDKLCELEKRDARSRQKSDPSVKIPKTMEAYISKFETETDGKEGRRLGALKNEAFIIDNDSTKAPRSKVTSFLKKIDSRIEEILDTTQLQAKEKQCGFSDENIKEYKVASEQFTERTEAINNYAQAMINHVESCRYQIANEVFPESYETMMMGKGSPLSVYNFIGKTHPVVARYLCYKMVMELDKKIAKLPDVITQSSIKGFENTDFDTEKKGVQTAHYMLNEANNKKSFFIFPSSKAISEVVEDYKKYYNQRIEDIKSYGTNQIKTATYRALRRRFDQLANNYEDFFQTIEVRIEGNNEKLNNLENSFIENPYGIHIVYGSPDAFKQSFGDFSKYSDFQVPEEAKEGVFLGLFRQATILFDNDTNVEVSPEMRKKTRIRVKEDIASLFDSAILKKIYDYVDVEGDKTVNISIKEAIVKQMKLEGYSEYSESFNKDRLDYEKKLIELAMSEAAPMISVNDNENTSENVYIAMNPAAGEQSGGEFNKAVTEDRIAEKTQATDYMIPAVLVNDSFSKYEIICMKVKHKYTVEQLSKYAYDSEFAELYRERIANIGLDPIVYGEDAYKTVVTPHLDQFWHEDGFLPELTKTERFFRDRMIRKAFFYAMGMDVFIREEVPGITSGDKWQYINIKKYRTPVREKGLLIRSGYVDLYKALRNNRLLVDNILERAEDDNEKERNSMGMLRPDDMINELSLLKDLIQEIPESDDSNILDILESMIRDERMKERSWDHLFEGIQLTLTEYLQNLFPDKYTAADDIYKEALDRMYKASNTGKKEASGAALDPIEKKIRMHMNRLKEISITY